MAEGTDNTRPQDTSTDFKGRTMYHLALDNDTNRPKGYIVAGTPGEPTIPGGPLLNYQGLAGKIVKGAKEGYDFIELDLWNDAEILEPHLTERIKQLRLTHKMDVGLHLRVNLDLTSAMGPIWDVNHKSLITGVLGATEVVKANFILMHSAATPILEFGEAAARTAPSTLLTPWKNNLAEFIEQPLHFDKDAKKRMIDDNESPRHNWNVFNEDNGNSGKLFESQCNSDTYIKQPTLKDWTLARFVKDIWYPGAVPDAKIVVALGKVKSLKEVRRAYKDAFQKLQSYFDINDKNIFQKKYEEKIKNIIDNDPFLKQHNKDIKKAEELEEKIKKTKENSEERKAIEQELNQLARKISDEQERAKNKTDELVSKLNAEYIDFLQLNSHQKNQYSPFKDEFARAFEDMILSLKKSIGDTYEIIEFNKVKKIVPKYPFNYSTNEKKDTKKIIEHMDDILNKNFVYVMIMYNHMGIDKNFLFWLQKGSEGEEQIAYWTLSKWMYLVKDPLYEEIIIKDREIIAWWENKETQKKVFKLNKKYIYPLAESEGASKKNLETFLDPDNIITYTNASGEPLNLPIRKMVTAVSAKYIQGHFDMPMQPDNQLYLVPPPSGDSDIFKASKNLQLKRMYIDPEKGNVPDNRKSIYKYLYDCGVHFYIETQDVLNEEWRGKVRIMRLTDHIAIIKAFKEHYKFDNVSYTMDFEHLTANLLNPQQQIEQLSPGDGKYLSMIHINPPVAAQGLHKVLKRMSFDVEYIYRWLYRLKQLGMSDAYFVWEMGKDTGGGTYEAPLAIRAIAGELTKGTKPKDLPEEFFGIDANFRAMQEQAIKAHCLDPMRDMFFFKPADHTFIGQLARAANAEAAEKERLR